MGHGSYKSTDWTKLKNARNITSQSSVTELYRSRQMQPQMNPYGVKYRESVDSPDNPESTAIIIGLDVTGSMGYLSESIARGALNKTMLEIYDKKPVTNPHIMFQAIGDSKSDAAPLQVTQFEADIRIVEQLLDVFFEGRGGGNGGESYLLTWYFAAKHTKIDCYDKRKKKGFIFTIGDERCHPTLEPAEIKKVFGDMAVWPQKAESLYREASEKYEVFHIVMKAGGYNYQKSGEAWKQLIGSHAIELEPDDLEKLPEILVSIMQAAGGKPQEQIITQWEPETAGTVAAILEGIGDFRNNGKIVF